MKHDENKKIRRIPLAERLQMARGANSFPLAVGLCDADFFRTIGRMTGEKEKYDQVYQSYIRMYGSNDETRVNVIDLVIQAEQLDDEALEKLLYWTLVEPFAAIKKAGENQKERKQ